METRRLNAAACLLAACAVALAALSGCSSSTGNTVTVNGATRIVFAKRSATALGDPEDSPAFSPGGDLMMMDISSPSGSIVNLTIGYTLGQGDVMDPEISYDGTRVLFSMRGPNDPTFNVFEMDLNTLALHRIIPDDATAHLGNDYGPAYLPDGRIVFSSDRQQTTRQILATQDTQPYTYLDEYERRQSTVLHTMNADGSNIQQISFNQSHDRNPTVLMSGQIMYARWDHLGGNNHFPIFFVDPDGTNLFVRYGAFSPGNSFPQPREMPNGKIMSTLMPLSRTFMGGALMGIDVQDFSENDQPVSPNISGNGQNQLTLDAVDFDMRVGIEPYGRYTTPYPLWDGTNRALVSWTPSRPTTTTDPLTGASIPTEGTPLYGVYMFALDQRTLQPIAIPPEGWAYLDPMPVMARPLPNIIPPSTLDQNLAAQGLGLLDIKSVYDTDFLDIMGQSVLAAGEVIPQTTPPAGDLRGSVADIARIKDPKQTTAAQRPARFLRIARAVPVPAGLSRQAIGNTEFEPEQIVGYTDIEPDGSARIIVPANTPLALAVVDSNGMAFQTHTNWIQVRPGETRTCDGCHSPRRGVALNLTPIAGNDPNTLLTPQAGESMAETRTRLYPSHMVPVDDIQYVDVWTDPAAAGRPADPPETITYAGLTTPAPQHQIADYPVSTITYNGATTPAPGGWVVNFPDQIAPIFTAVRGTNTCTNCHNNSNSADTNSVGLDLRDVPAGSGRAQSYETLTIGPIKLDANGNPVIQNDDGNLVVERGDPLIRTGSSKDSSRSSRFFEEMLGKQLLSGTPLPPQTVNHQGMLNASELRLLAEWSDLGGTYYNDPFNAPPGVQRTPANVRGVSGLSETQFDSTVHPILMNRCAGCHQPFNSSGSKQGQPNAAFQNNQFVLTGDDKGDYDVTLTMITDVCTPAQNPLLLRPTSTSGSGAYPHPQVGNPPGPVLTTSDPDYTTILNWISTGTCTIPS